MSGGVTGRPPKPTRLKILQGTARADRMPKNEPRPGIGIPTRPEWLSPEAKREWTRITKELEPLEMLARVDRAALAAYCQCWGLYVEAVRDIQENGTTFTTETGYEGPRPSVGVMVKMLEKMSAYAAKFGLSPSDRARLSIPEPKQEDPFADFLSQKAGNE